MTVDGLIPEEIIISKIYLIRGQKVMLDKDLAELYGVETKVFNQTIKRNSDRFPADFMFELTEEEFKNLRSQIVTSSWGGNRYTPKVFTEQGVSMLSSVLNSKIAIDVNIRIIRIFTKLRESILTHKDILLKLEQIERKLISHDEELELIFKYLKELLNPAQKPIEPIGYKSNNSKKEAN